MEYGVNVTWGTDCEIFRFAFEVSFSVAQDIYIFFCPQQKTGDTINGAIVLKLISKNSHIHLVLVFAPLKIPADAGKSRGFRIHFARRINNSKKLQTEIRGFNYRRPEGSTSKNTFPGRSSAFPLSSPRPRPRTSWARSAAGCALCKIMHAGRALKKSGRERERLDAPGRRWFTVAAPVVRDLFLHPWREVRARYFTVTVVINRETWLFARPPRSADGTADESIDRRNRNPGNAVDDEVLGPALNSAVALSQEGEREREREWKATPASSRPRDLRGTEEYIHEQCLDNLK